MREPACGPLGQVWVWRHPRPLHGEGRCIGRSDLPVDRRRAKRLANRILAAARRHGLPREIWTSPLERCACVGRMLRRHGFVHRIDERLIELDFGAWDGRHWNAIAPAEVAAWEADFAEHAPGGGESLAAMKSRVRRFISQASSPCLIVGHAGWIGAAQQAQRTSTAASWPAAPRWGTLTVIETSVADSSSSKTSARFAYGSPTRSAR
ncbi:histidine phosphatase family protein [Piscinibacter sp.]|uniref:histidine phosphatase family protein n=1 Tax=Piscinibacter sp. TaxID=1903157 RepID=UPI002D7EB494|nr:histidine phosphatase family protein [Albitalea sp.]